MTSLTSPGEWKKIKIIGKGGSSTVFKAAVKGEAGKFIAVKQIDTVGLLDNQISNIELEIATIRELNHPNIIRYLGTERTENKIYILLEYADRGSLRQYYQRKGPLRESQTASCTAQILSGLEYLHAKGIAHRDIKCANILLTQARECKLADFGASKNYHHMSVVSGLKGTPNWMAPEVIKGDQMTDGWLHADVWSLGCTVVEMASGNMPYSNYDNPMTAMYHIANGEAPSVRDVEVSSHLQSFVHACCAIDPTQRPSVLTLLQHTFVLPYMPSAEGKRVSETMDNDSPMGKNINHNEEDLWNQEEGTDHHQQNKAMNRMDSTEDLFSSLDDPNDEIDDPYDMAFDMTQRSTPEEEEETEEYADDFIANTAVDMEKMLVAKHDMDKPVSAQTTVNHNQHHNHNHSNKNNNHNHNNNNNNNNNNSNNNNKNGTKESTGQRVTGKGTGLRVYTGSEMDDTIDRNTSSERPGIIRPSCQDGSVISATTSSSSGLSPRTKHTIQEPLQRDPSQRTQLQDAITPNMTSGTRTTSLRRGFHNQSTTTTTTGNNHNSTATIINSNNNSTNNSNVGSSNRGTGQKSMVDTRKNLTQLSSHTTKPQQQPSSSSSPSSSLSSKQPYGTTSTNSTNNNSNKTITNSSSSSSSKNTITAANSSNNKTLAKSLPRGSKGIALTIAIANGNHQKNGMTKKIGIENVGDNLDISRGGNHPSKGDPSKGDQGGGHPWMHPDEGPDDDEKNEQRTLSRNKGGMLQPIDPQLLEEILSQTQSSHTEPKTDQNGGHGSSINVDGHDSNGSDINTSMDPTPFNNHHHLNTEITTHTSTEEKTLHSVRERWHEISETSPEILSQSSSSQIQSSSSNTQSSSPKVSSDIQLLHSESSFSLLSSTKPNAPLLSPQSNLRAPQSNLVASQSNLGTSQSNLVAPQSLSPHDLESSLSHNDVDSQCDMVLLSSIGDDQGGIGSSDLDDLGAVVSVTTGSTKGGDNYVKGGEHKGDYKGGERKGEGVDYRGVMNNYQNNYSIDGYGVDGYVGEGYDPRGGDYVHEEALEGLSPLKKRPSVDLHNVRPSAPLSSQQLTMLSDSGTGVGVGVGVNLSGTSLLKSSSFTSSSSSSSSSSSLSSTSGYALSHAERFERAGLSGAAAVRQSALNDLLTYQQPSSSLSRSLHHTKGKKGGGGGIHSIGNHLGGGNNSSLDNYYGSTMGEKIHHHHHHHHQHLYPNHEYHNNNELRSKSAGISGSSTNWGGGGYGGMNRLAPLGAGSTLNHHGMMSTGGENDEELSRSNSLDEGRLLGALPRFVHSAPAVARSLNLPPLQAFHGNLTQLHVHEKHRGDGGKGIEGGYQNLSGSTSSQNLHHGPPPFSIVQFSRSQSDFSDIRSNS